MTRDLSIGLIGYGAIGKVHALCFQMLPLSFPQLGLRPRITVVQSSSDSGEARTRSELGEVRVVRSIEELLASGPFDFVDCCAPTGEHERLARAVLEAGLPLFCEKPLAVEPAQSVGLAELAAQRGLVCGVNYHFRGIPALREAKRWIEAGNLGDVVHVQLRYQRASNLKRDRPANWRFQGPGSGVLTDLGSHMIDMTEHLFGPIAALSARTRTLFAERPTSDGGTTQIESDDAAWLALELAGGGRGSIHASKVAPGAADDVRIEAYGTKGSLVFDTADPNTLLLADQQNGQRRIAVYSKAVPAVAYPNAEQATAPLFWHLDSITSYLIALQGGPAAQATFAQAARVDTTIATALDSAGNGGAWKNL